ncbi:MAG: hypothetical protein N4A46_00945, partial [Schleiferiaceae bacterium]|nr:hypothetical protein [Schleiferiaceae bacterium]
MSVEGQTASDDDAALNVEGKLTIESGGQLRASQDAYFYVSGDIQYEGNAFVRSRSIFTLNGSSSQSVFNTGDTIDFKTYQLIIDNPTSVVVNTINNATLDVFDILDVKQGNLITNDKLYIESLLRTSPTRIFHGRVATLGPSASITGDALIEKRVSNTDDGWRQLALPVEATISSLSSSSATFFVDGHTPKEQINTLWWDAGPSGTGDYANGWTNANSTDGQLKAYAVFLSGTNGIHNLSNTFSFLGKLNEGDYTNSLSYQRDPADASATIDEAIGWNFIPNPWPAYIDVFEFINNSTEFTSAYKAVHVWDAVNQQYRAIIGNGITKTDYNTDGSDLDTASTNIPTFQGFWVKATASSQTANLIEATMRTTDIKDNALFMKREYPTIRLNIGDASNKSDQLVLYFNENASREFDYYGDAYFLRSQNENAFSFYGKEGQSKASIISRKENQKDSVEIFYENPLSQSHFKIQADLSKAEQMNNVYLKDKSTGYIYNLEDGETLAFAHKSNSTSPRFILYYSNNPTDFKGLVAQANSSIVAFIKDD